MNALHPASIGTAVAVWFVDDAPVRLVSGTERFRVIDDPRCADINGVRYWRVRAVGVDGRTATFDLRAGNAGWVLVGVDEDTTRTGSR